MTVYLKGKFENYRCLAKCINLFHPFLSRFQSTKVPSISHSSHRPHPNHSSNHSDSRMESSNASNPASSSVNGNVKRKLSNESAPTNDEYLNVRIIDEVYLSLSLSSSFSFPFQLSLTIALIVQFAKSTKFSCGCCSHGSW